MTFTKTAKQIEAVRLMGSEPKYTLLYGGSRCLTGDTLVLTYQGYKQIKDIQVGEYLPSLSEVGKINKKQVVNKYLVAGEQTKQKVIIFVLLNNTKITCSYEHRLLFEGRYIEANVIARRALEGSEELRRSLSDKQFRTTGINELLRIRQSQRESRDNDTCTGWQWLSEDNDKDKRQRYNSEDAQTRCTALDNEPREQTSNKSYRSQSQKQCSCKSGMGDIQGEYRSYDESGEADSKQWGKKWDGHNYRRSRKKDKIRTQKEDSYTINACREIQLHGKLYKGCVESENLEAREISLTDIVCIEYSEVNGLLYDIEVEDNHNYFITKSNIISHNSGKSFIVIRQIILRALKEAGSRHLIVRFAFNHAKQSLWHDTIPKCLDLCFSGVKPVWNKSDWFIEFPNGSQIWVGGLDDKDRTEKVLGNEYCTIFLNEASQISYSSFTIVLTRLAQNTGLVNRVYCDCNPPSITHWTYKLFVQHVNPDSNEAINGKYYSHMRMNPDDNLENLPDDYIESVLNTLSHRQQKRFRYGEFTDDVEGALWTWEMIDKFRVTQAPELRSVVVAIDPSGTSTQTSDEAGILAVGLGIDRHGYVLEDISGIMTPNAWATLAIRLLDKYNGDHLVAEVNQGWAMVKTVIHNIDNSVRVLSVAANKGKVARAEPVVGLYERGLIHHVGIHAKLEDQMTTWDSRENTISPGRIDALVYAVSDLLCKQRTGFVLVD